MSEPRGTGLQTIFDLTTEDRAQIQSLQRPLDVIQDESRAAGEALGNKMNKVADVLGSGDH